MVCRQHTPCWVLKKQALLGFSGKIDRRFLGIPSIVVGSGAGVVGGGWLLVEMCIVDASILLSA